MDDDGFWCIDCALQHLDLEVSERTDSSVHTSTLLFSGITCSGRVLEHFCCVRT